MTIKLPINLEDLLRQRTVEGERIEYKAGWNPDAVLRTICAFANDFHNLGGGYIVIGVEEDKGRPVLPPKGLPPESVDRILKELLNLGHSAMRPNYHPLSADYCVDGRMILVLSVPGGEVRPYKARMSSTNRNNDWTYYIRKNASTVRAKDEGERELFALATTVPFDDRYHQGARLDDLSFPLMKEFLGDVNSDLVKSVDEIPREALGLRMNFVGGPSESLFPKNVGLLFFNENPYRFFPATQIDVLWFPEGPGGDRFEEKIFQGTLARITRDAIAFIDCSYVKETVLKHADRPEVERFWNFPMVAVEEALVNAVYHRSYQEREPVEIRITPEELIVLSFPGPDRSIRMEDLVVGKAVSRRYRNRRIGEFLKELELAEGRSTGIPKIIHAMSANGSPPPEFETNADRDYFIARLPVHMKASRGRSTDVGQHGGLGGDVADEAGTKWGPSWDQAKVLRNTHQDTTLLDMMAILGRSNRTKFRDQIMRPLMEAGLIEMTRPGKPRSSKQRYRLTEAGQRWLEGPGARA